MGLVLGLLCGKVVCGFGVWDAACCGTIALVLGVVFCVVPAVLVVLGGDAMFVLGVIVAPLVIKIVYLFVGV